jgi:hypothetical protein
MKSFRTHTPVMFALATFIYVALAFGLEALSSLGGPTPRPVDWKAYVEILGHGGYSLPAVLAGVFVGFFVGRSGGLLGFCVAFIGAVAYRFAFESSLAPGVGISLDFVTIAALASAGLAIVGLVSGLAGEHLSHRRHSQRAL